MPRPGRVQDNANTYACGGWLGPGVAAVQAQCGYGAGMVWAWHRRQAGWHTAWCGAWRRPRCYGVTDVDMAGAMVVHCRCNVRRGVTGRGGGWETVVLAATWVGQVYV
jgi:hypothetical protein